MNKICIVVIVIQQKKNELRWDRLIEPFNLLLGILNMLLMRICTKKCEKYAKQNPTNITENF